MEEGRPPLFKTSEELESKIEDYFNGGYNTRDVLVGRSGQQEIAKIPLITITGLCHYLGFESRQSFYDYEKKSEFTYIVKKARLRIESNYEELMQTNSPVGAIFALKNMGWEDQRKHEVTGDGIAPVIINKISEDQ